MVTLLILKQEVRGRIPVPPHQSLEPKHPHTPPPGCKDLSRVPERDGVRESQAPGMTKKTCKKVPFLWLGHFFRWPSDISIWGNFRAGNETVSSRKNASQDETRPSRSRLVSWLHLSRPSRRKFSVSKEKIDQNIIIWVKILGEILRLMYLVSHHVSSREFWPLVFTRMSVSPYRD